MRRGDDAPGSIASYVGRFAPTPSGALHLGSLYTAVASFLDARAHGGRWLLRMEDLDRAREAPGSADAILGTLERFGLEWDGPVVRQSVRGGLYARALDALRERGLTFQCSCSRAELAEEDRYPGTCRNAARAAGPTASRLRVEPGSIAFHDRVQGDFAQDVAAAVGDVILRRRDQVAAYLLAVVVDDAEQGVTHVVRGADLLDNTPRQILLQRLLGAPTPVYAHVPALTEPDGAKLAKSRRSVSVDAAPVEARLLEVLSLLGLEPPAVLRGAGAREALRWAVSAWDLNGVPKRIKLRLKA
ncbi:MAG TPA: tRNA glutamyl-Q(34) synthetase GluQRS [Steroidobacteraceae bacterium]|jgi:glutamyl-Q tRNA(Asp) synthetase|nr:tRNA glutamyl-Q(34) synthetase GluQRS [Steroidobacteraceae bacterium]